jgi:hypothetical protein
MAHLIRGGWERGIAYEKHGDMYTVYLVDRGMDHKVAIADMRPLPPVIGLPACAVQVINSNMEIWGQRIGGTTNTRRISGQYCGAEFECAIGTMVQNFFYMFLNPIGGCAHSGTLPVLPVHPASPVLHTKNGPLGAGIRTAGHDVTFLFITLTARDYKKHVWKHSPTKLSKC